MCDKSANIKQFFTFKIADTKSISWNVFESLTPAARCLPSASPQTCFSGGAHQCKIAQRHVLVSIGSQINHVSEDHELIRLTCNIEFLVYGTCIAY